MKFLLASVLLLSAFSAQADVVQYSAPAEYCFPQTSVRSEFRKFDKIILDHNLVVNQQDHFKTGDVFVGFRRKSQPDALWLTNGSRWVNAADNSESESLAYPVILPNSDGTLQPVMPVTLSREPIDVSTYVEDGEVWVGYGLKVEGESWKKSFEDMMSDQRYKRIWDITGLTPESGLPANMPTICLKASEMRTVVLTAGHDLPKEVVLDIDSVGIANGE